MQLWIMLLKSLRTKGRFNNRKFNITILAIIKLNWAEIIHQILQEVVQGPEIVKRKDTDWYLIDKINS